MVEEKSISTATQIKVNVTDENSIRVDPVPLSPRPHQKEAVLPTRHDWMKFMNMKKAGVPVPAILQNAQVMGKIHDDADRDKLESLLMDDDDAAIDDREALMENGPKQTINVYVKYQKYAQMKKVGVPTESILQSARIEGMEDTSELERMFHELDYMDSKRNKKNKSKNKNKEEEKKKKDNDDDESRNTNAGAGAGGSSTDTAPAKYSRFIQMKKVGVSTPFILQQAKNQGIEDTKELEGIFLVIDAEKKKNDGDNKPKASEETNTKEVKDVKEEKKGKHFTPIEKKKKEDSNDDDDIASEAVADVVEKVAFHRAKTSPLASLVRRMVHTVDKTNRTYSQYSRTNLNSKDQDMIVTMDTLYNSLGSLIGVQHSRDQYNETILASNNNSTNNSIGWIRAKRQSFREIAKSIGLKKLCTMPGSGESVNVDGLDELIEFVQHQYKDRIEENISLIKNESLYDFESLPMMYVPGTKVVAQNVVIPGQNMICKVAWNRIKTGKTLMGKISKHFEVCFEFVVAINNNRQATIVEVIEGIDQFDGRRSIFSGGAMNGVGGADGLSFIPLMAYDDGDDDDDDHTKNTTTAVDQLLQRYKHRGQMYNEVALNSTNKGNGNGGVDRLYSYKSYSAGSFFMKRSFGSSSKSFASQSMANGGRIVIDAQAAYEYGNSLNTGRDTFITAIQMKQKEFKLLNNSTNNSNNKSPNVGGGNGNNNGAENNDAADDGGLVLFDVIPDDYLEFAWPCVIGFSLTSKAWGDCLIDGLDDIDFSPDVFDRLVLPNDRKRLIKALVKHSSPLPQRAAAIANANKPNFQDLIQGKGEGTVFLLYGPPGCGKTLTAEAVAEVLHRPLYSLSMGTLGTTADDLERRLSEILKLSAKWNAIILLDEADSFLEKRSSTSSLERNAMVSVMLQLVEYFTGILFLTSNRIDSLDPAFQTRITLSLPYHDLNADGRRKIWDNLLYKSGVVALDDDDDVDEIGVIIDTKELAKHPLNGREIKNALRLALALAAEEECPLSQSLLMETSAMVKPISMYCSSSSKYYDDNDDDDDDDL